MWEAQVEHQIAKDKYPQLLLHQIFFFLQIEDGCLDLHIYHWIKPLNGWVYFMNNCEPSNFETCLHLTNKEKYPRLQP